VTHLTGLVPLLDKGTSERMMSVEITPLKAPTHPGALKLVSYVEEKRANNDWPRRRNLPDKALASIMPNIFMLAPADPDGADWRFRLVGQEIVDRLGFDPTGSLISTLFAPEEALRHAKEYRDVIAGTRDSISRCVFRGIDRDFLTMEIIHVPMLGADGETFWILGGMFFRT